MTNGGRHHHPHTHPQHPHPHHPEGPDPTLLQPELVGVALVKGPGGFGFAIADCPLGQKVKMILDAQWCRGLLKGDVIKEVDRRNVQTLSHAQVVDILKELPVGAEVGVLVLRGGHTSPVKSLKPCTAPMSHTQPHPQPRPETTTSTETLTPAEPHPQPLPFPAGTLRSASPKADPSELYLKSKAMLDSKPPHTKDLDVFIKRNQESGFGFRVLGGEGPDQPVYIGAIVPLGAAEKDGRLRAGDELLCIDGVPVKGKSHKQVLELMTNAARNGQVMLTVRRKLPHAEGGGEEESIQQQQQQPPQQQQAAVAPAPVNGSPKPPPPGAEPDSYDVTLQRRDNEGFGFVILTSKNKPPPGVIPHKIGRIIEGSPTDRGGRPRVGDRISAVNGRSIVALSHNDIVQLIKEAGNAVTLTVVPEDENSEPASGTSSAKQSPSAQHKAMGQQPACHSDRNGNADERKDAVGWPEYRSLPHGESASCPKQGSFIVELERGPRGFGFSLRGGKEYNMGLFILRLAEHGAALKDGRVHVGDQIVEINGEPTQGITHTRAIELIQAGGTKVLLLLRPGLGLVPDRSTKEKATISSSILPRLSASDEASSPASPSSVSLAPSSSELSPSPSPAGAAADEAPREREHAGPANRPQGQQPHPQRHHRRTSSPGAAPDREPQPRKSEAPPPHAEQPASPRRGAELAPERTGRSQSPRKTDRGRSGAAEPRSGSQEGEGGQRRDRRASSPRKSSRRGQEADTGSRPAPKSQEDSLRRSGGPQANPAPATADARDRRRKEEDPTAAAARRQEREAGDSLPRGTNERRRKDKGAEREAAPPDRSSQPQSQRERAGHDADGGTLNRKGGRERERERDAREGKHRGAAAEEEEVKKETRLSSGSSSQEPACNGAASGRKTPITPGPWKVPSTAKIQSQGDLTRDGN